MDATRRSRSATDGRRGSFLFPLKASVLGDALAATFGLAPATALAQDVPAPGITTIGYGEASAPAETATLQIVLTQEEYGPPRPPRGDATPGAEQREAAAPAVDALVSAGVAEEDIELVVSPALGEYYGPFGPGAVRLDVAVEEPTTERVQELINAAILGAAEEDLFVGQVGVGYEVADCAALERQARQAAIEDARERAELQADLLGVELGDPVASSDRPVDPTAGLVEYFGPSAFTGGGCAPPLPRATAGAPVTLPLFDPTTEAEVEVYVQVAITFEIAGTGSP